MQIDMHFYGVYALARAAGIQDKAARIIAYCSQYVDDATEDDEVEISRDFAIVPTMTSHKPLDFQNAMAGDQWKVWVPFHFLPGNEPTDGSFVERMACRKNSRPAQQMLTDTLAEKNRPLWPHLIGVVAHVFADTFAHYGFVGISHGWNKVKNRTITTHNVVNTTVLQNIAAKLEKYAGVFAELVPVGHGSVDSYPDTPFLSWEYEPESAALSGGKVTRNNAGDFLEGARELHRFFGQFAEKARKYADDRTRRQWPDIEAPVKAIIGFESEDKAERVKRWKQAIRDGELFPPSRIDIGVNYDKYHWEVARLKYIEADRSFARESDACRFIRAAWYHRLYVLQQLLPQFNLTVY